MRNKSALEMRKERARQGLCGACGRAIANRRPDATFCSAACKQAHYRQRLEAKAEATRRAIDLAHTLIG